MATMLEIIKIIVPVFVAVVTSIATVLQKLKNNKLSRQQKIEEVLTQGVNIAEQLGKLGKLGDISKLDYVLNYACNQLNLKAQELVDAKTFIENAFVSFFSNPATEVNISEIKPAIVHINEPTQVIPVVKSEA